jgi:two-component system chemotaxis sensor kinase CheA
MAENGRLDFSIFLDEYLTDAREGFQTVNNALLALEKDFTRIDLIDEIFRVVHTLKSSSKMLEFSEIAEFGHMCEDFIDNLRKHEIPLNQNAIALLFEITDTLETMIRERASAQKTGLKGEAVEDIYQNETIQKMENIKQKIEGKNITGDDIKTVKAPTIEKIQTVRINVDILDALFNLVGELIIGKNRMNNLIADTDKKEIKLTMATIVHIIDELQEKVSEARMVPVDEVFRKFPRMVRDLAASAGKEIDLVVEGSEIELDKSVLDAIGEPLIHLLRNALDHGIEPPDKRQNFGKKRKGLVRLIARRAENHILIEVGDDGRGIDIPLMRDFAVKKGFTKTEEIGLLEDKDILKLIFKPGFSSSENVTEVSGRGVGLDIVKSVTERLNGMVEVATEKGRGTRFILKLPISPAIIQTLMVSVGNHVFAIPSDLAIETL